MSKSLAGTRIRERRRAQGLRQGELAKAAGISASYLNLIEHNRRKPTARVIRSVADVLGLSVEVLAEGAEFELIENLRGIAADHAAHGPEGGAVEELIGRFPGWAQTISAQNIENNNLASAIAMLSDRLNFDPHLQGTLHEMLTTITAIRSTAGILTQEPDLSISESARFNMIVHSESVRLSDVAQKLVDYFDQYSEAANGSAQSYDQFEHFLSKRDYVFPELETDAGSEGIVKNLIDDSPLLRTVDAKARAHSWLAQYANDAALMPLGTFAAVARTSGYAPQHIARDLSQDVHAVLRRLATLKRDGLDAPAFGAVIINASGYPLFRRPLPEFSLPRFSTICALWPVFQAMSAPMQPIEEIISLPNGREFLARAFSSPLGGGDPMERPTFASGMIVASLPDAQKFELNDAVQTLRPRAVGTSCRLCLRAICPARSEPSILPAP